MRYVMNRPNSRLWALAIAALLLSALVLLLTACAAAPLTPLPTAIPLAATATPRPAPTHPSPTAAASQIQPTPAPPPAPPTAAADRGISSTDELLARRTVEDLLARLERDETDSIVDLYLSDRGLQAGVAQIFLDLRDGGRELAGSDLLEFRRATASSYEARLLLRWTKDLQGEAATQPMTLRLVSQRGLWLVDQVSLGDLRTIPPAPRQGRPATAGSSSRPAALAGRLVFQVSSGGPIYLIDADGSNLARLTDGLDPAWSPTGDRIAFARWRYPGGVYLIESDGSGEQRVVDGNRLKEVAWSPDGQKIAFTVNRGSSEPTEVCFFGFCFTIPAFSAAQVWIADLESGGFLSLPLDDKAVHAPAWSPAGGRIVYAGERGLAWIDLDDMETGRFPGGSAWDTSPAFSPDGKQVAFMGRVHNRWEVLVMNADGSGRRQLTHSDPDLEDPPSNVAPAWSPDGRSIAFLSNRDGPWRIYVMAADGSDQRPMFGNQLDRLGLRYEWATERVLSWTE
jgi:dipeptidyl aminopeptidase/acylaminoacyl peptidase